MVVTEIITENLKNEIRTLIGVEREVMPSRFFQADRLTDGYK